MLKLTQNIILKWAGYHRIEKILNSMPEKDASEFLFRSIEEFNVSSQIIGANSEEVRSTVFVCTHHSGILDLLSIYPFLYKKAPNLKIVANKELLKLKVLAPILITVNAISTGQKNNEAKDLMIEHLKNGGNLLIYPAGKVANKTKGKIVDFPWRTGIADILKEHALKVTPIYVDAKNTSFFYLVRRLFPKLNVLFLLRALHVRKNKTINAYFGTPLVTETFTNHSPIEVMDALRLQTYKLESNSL